MRLSKALMDKRLTARRLTVFLTLKSFDQQAATTELPYPTADYFVLMAEANKAVDGLFDASRVYRACGLIAMDIAVRQAGTFDLFQQAERQREDKHLQLLEAVHRVNRKYGDNVLAMCGAAKPGRKVSRARFNYPIMECS